jgi:threonine/homoserine/homoserine lactone efflux protein
VTDWWQFLLATFLLLAVPGPTNTLLAAAGAARGIRACLPLTVAELAGYLTSVLVLTLVAGSVFDQWPGALTALKLGCAVYLLFVAWKLWRSGPDALASAAPVSTRDVFVATLLNPKGLVMAFTIMPPYAADAPWRIAPYLVALAAVIGVCSVGWITVGASITARFNGASASRYIRRTAAFALGAFSIVLTNSAFR